MRRQQTSKAGTLLGLVLGFGVSLSLVACGSDSDDVLRVVPPLVVRSIVPDSGIRDFVGTQNLSVTFDRAPGAGNVIMELFPMPAQSGTYGPTGSGRNWTWFDVELTAEDGAYAWLIDAVLMPQPLIVHFASGDRSTLVGFEGTVTSPDRELVVPAGTVVFALPPDAAFNPLDPATFLDVRPTAISATVARDPRPPEVRPAEHRFPFMEGNTAYLVVAVKDTNDDLVYDPTSDWWGYATRPMSIEPEIVIANPFDDEEYNANVNIVLRPPGAVAQ